MVSEKKTMRPARAAKTTRSARAAKAAKRKAETRSDSGVRDYELTVILSPALEEEKVDTVLDGISKLIAAGGGAVANVDRWGKRKLAYPIRGFLEGTYVLTQFNMKPGETKELESKLLISEDVLRHLLIKVA